MKAVDVDFYTGWWFQKFLFSISYMGCHPSHWRTHIFQGEIAPPTSQYIIEIVIYPANFLVIFHSFLYVDMLTRGFSIDFKCFSEAFRNCFADGQWIGFLGQIFTGKPHDLNMGKSMVSGSNFRWESTAPGAECKLGALGVLLSSKGIRGSKLDRDVAFCWENLAFYSWVIPRTFNWALASIVFWYVYQRVMLVKQ